MTKKLEDLLNIADDKPSQKSATKAETAITDQNETFRDIAEFDKIASALPAVKGLIVPALIILINLLNII